jgi:hypothetical protein
LNLKKISKNYYKNANKLLQKLRKTSKKSKNKKPQNFRKISKDWMYLEWPNRIWVASLDLILFLDFLKLFVNMPLWGKLHVNTNFIIFGPMD